MDIFHLALTNIDRVLSPMFYAFGITCAVTVTYATIEHVKRFKSYDKMIREFRKAEHDGMMDLISQGKTGEWNFQD